MPKFLTTIDEQPIDPTSVQAFMDNFQTAAHERRIWRSTDFQLSDFACGALLFFATFPQAGTVPNDLLDCIRNQPAANFLAPMPIEQITALANSVQVDVHEGVLQPDEWQETINTVRQWLDQHGRPLPPIPVMELNEAMEELELDYYYHEKNGQETPDYLHTVRAWLVQIMERLPEYSDMHLITKEEDKPFP